jgi:hypothetical protein
MRKLWNIVSFLAVVHILALLFVVIWLWQTKRLTVDRVREAKMVFAPTLPEVAAAAKKSAAAAQEEQLKEAEAAKKANPPLDSATQIQYISLVRQQEAQSRQRLNDDQKMLRQQLALTSAQIDDRQALLASQQAKLEAANRPDLQRKIDEQFMQTVKQYELAAPKQAKKMVVELINGGQQEQAVAYLKAMNPRNASKILKEFKTDSEIVMAKELLEKLRTLGLEATATAATSKPVQEPGNAPSPSNTAQPATKPA